ncbi:MAG: hypothetical protein V1672_04320 [Candidatus Diapherotrites archaeon]
MPAKRPKYISKFSARRRRANTEARKQFPECGTKDETFQIFRNAYHAIILAEEFGGLNSPAVRTKLRFIHPEERLLLRKYIAKTTRDPIQRRIVWELLKLEKERGRYIYPDFPEVKLTRPEINALKKAQAEINEHKKKKTSTLKFKSR